MIQEASADPHHLLYPILPLFTENLTNTLSLSEAFFKRPQFDCTIAVKALETFQLKCPSVLDVVEVYLNYAI